MPQAQEPVLSASGGRLRLSVSELGAVVLFAGLIALVVLAFLWGRRVGRRDAVAAAGEHAVRSAQFPVTPVHGPGRQTLDGAANDRAAQVQRKPGYSYFVIQDRISALDEAKDIQAFLAERKVQVTIHASAVRPFYRVKDCRGFTDLSSPTVKAQIASYKARIEAYGSEYMDQGGRYGFRKPWMETERQPRGPAAPKGAVR